MDVFMGSSSTPVVGLENVAMLRQLVRQRVSSRTDSAAGGTSDTSTGGASMVSRPWQQLVPHTPTPLASLVRTRTLARSPHGAGFGETGEDQEKVATKTASDLEFETETIIVEDEGNGGDELMEERKPSFWKDLWNSPTAQLKKLVRTP